MKNFEHIQKQQYNEHLSTQDQALTILTYGHSCLVQEPSIHPNSHGVSAWTACYFICRYFSIPL